MTVKLYAIQCCRYLMGQGAVAAYGNIQHHQSGIDPAAAASDMALCMWCTFRASPAGTCAASHEGTGCSGDAPGASGSAGAAGGRPSCRWRAAAQGRRSARRPGTHPAQPGQPRAGWRPAGTPPAHAARPASLSRMIFSRSICLTYSCMSTTLIKNILLSGHY